MLADDLRSVLRAVLDSGMTIYRVCQLTGLYKGTINAFLAGGDISTARAELIACAIGHKITLSKGRRRKPLSDT